MPHYIQSDGPSIKERGAQAIKEPHPVYLVESDVPFTVSTNEGTLSGNAGDYVAYDPTSGHIWPVSAEYVDMHYRWLVDNEEEKEENIQGFDEEEKEKNIPVFDEKDHAEVPAPRSGEE